MNKAESIKAAIEEIIEDLDDLDDWQDRFRYIIELGQEFPPLAEAYHTEAYKVDGCVSQVWLRAYLQGGQVIFEADSDAVIVRGLVAMLVRVYSGRQPEEILSTPPDFLLQTGITRNLSPNRANGLASMVRKMMTYAKAFQEQLEREANP